jgi:hypothetical protein
MGLFVSLVLLDKISNEDRLNMFIEPDGIIHGMLLYLEQRPPIFVQDGI